MTNTLTVKVYFYLDAVWTDVTSDVLAASRIDASWGMGNNKPMSLVADIGQLTFSLDNSTGKYTPFSGTALSGWKKGTAVKVVFTFLSQDYVRFYGKVDKMRIDAGTVGNRRVHVTVLDWLDYAVKHPLKNPAIEQDKTAGDALTLIVDAMPIQPAARDFDTGINTFPLVFNEATQKTRAYSEFQKLMVSEFGRLYLKKDATYGETLVFEESDARPTTTPVKTVTVLETPGFLLKEDGGYLLKEDGGKLMLESFTTSDVSIDNTMISMDVSYGDNVINRITTTVNPTKIATTPSLLYELDNPIFIDANEEVSFNIQFTEASSKRLVAALPPDGTTYPQVLLHFDVKEGVYIVYDEAGHFWDAIDVQIVNNVKKIGGGSAYMDGTGSYIYSVSSDDFELGTNDFTIEWYEYRFNATASCAAVSRSGAGGFVPFTLGYSDGTNSLIYMTSNGASWDIANGKSLGAITTNTWIHYAVTRSGTTFRAFREGVQTDTWTSSASILASTADFVIGKSGSNYITACIDEFRMINGEARYTAGFTPPTDPLTLSGVVYAAWTNSIATGTELTGDFVITDTYGAAGADLVVRNNATVGGYLTTLKIYSYIVESVNAITDVQEDTASVNEYGYSELSINQPYQQELVNATVEAARILEQDRQPLLVLNKVRMSANRSDAMALTFLQTDVGDLVEVIEDQTGINASYFIQGFEFSVQAGADGQIVEFGWVVQKFLSALVDVGIEFVESGSPPYAQYVDYGYLPLVSGAGVDNRIVSFWYKGANTENGYVFSTYYNDTGQSIRFLGSGIISLSSSNFAVTGTWSTVSNAIPATSSTNWTHVLVAYDKSSTTNDPTFYVNGSLVSSSETITPSGSPTSELNSVLWIGLSNFDKALANGITGQFKDYRIYNGASLTPATLASAIYSAGAGSDTNLNGLIFRTFSVRQDDLSLYVDVALDESLKLIDEVSLAVGTPKNSPTARAF